MRESLKNITGLFRWLNVLLILTTFIAYLSPYISPSSFWPVSIFGLAFPVLFILNFLFFCYWIIRRKRYLLLSLCCMLLGWGHFSSNFGFGGGEKAENAKNQISIINFNTRNLRHVQIHRDKNQRKRQIKKFEDWLSAQETDIFLLQETANLRIKDINKVVQLPHLYQPKGKRVAILSRYPIINSGVVELNSFVHLALWADLQVAEDKVIRFYSLHLKSSSLNREAIDAVAAGKVREKETWSGVWGLIKVYKNHASTRAGQAEKVLAHVRKSPYPVVVGGDFNETPSSFVYHQFHKELKDAFRSAGKGYGSTYRGKIPLLRIDYLFHDPNFKVLEHTIHRKPFSDHYPVKTRLSW